MAKFQIQTTSSHVNWTGKKILGLHTGSIRVSNGHLQLNEGKISGEVTMDMSSITIADIDDPKTHKNFKDHLFNDDFFSVDKFPNSHLKINDGIPLGENRYEIHGTLTIKGIARPVTFTAKIEILTNTCVSFGELVIDRTNYNIRYGSGKFIGNLGDNLIYDDFLLQFNVVGQKQN